MGIRSAIDDAYVKIATADEMKQKALTSIEAIQASCPHQWKFVKQVNAFHADLWNVHRKCTLCDKEHIDEKVPPICSRCGHKLRRASKHDAYAKVERCKPEHQGHYNPPEAWRCTKCGHCEILHVRGD